MLAAKLSLSSNVDIWSRISALRQNSLDLLSPAMRAAVVATLKYAQGKSITVTLADGRTDTVKLDPLVYETLRSDELQSIYYSQGTTKAKTAEESWHFYGLAADTISIEYEWFDGDAARTRWPDERDREIVSDAWFGAMAAAGARFGLSGGIDWPTFPDPPHLQWGRCARSPHDAPQIYRSNGGSLRGRQAVWTACNALYIPAEIAAAAA